MISFQLTIVKFFCQEFVHKSESRSTARRSLSGYKPLTPSLKRLWVRGFLFF